MPWLKSHQPLENAEDSGAFCAAALGVPAGWYILYAAFTYLGMLFLVICNLSGYRIALAPQGERTATA